MVGVRAHKRTQHKRVYNALSPIVLDADERTELAWLESEAPPAVARRARIVLLYARGLTLSAVARSLGVDRATARRWIRRFAEQGLRGLAHPSGGQARKRRFEQNLRDAVVRVALTDPRDLSEDFDSWSLRRLQGHLLRRGLVKQISVEGLRQLISGVPLPAEFWRRKPTKRLTLTPEERAGLEQLAQGSKESVARRARIILARANGLQEAEIAAAVGMGPSSVRYWIRRFRVHRMLGIQTERKRARPILFTPELRRQILAVAQATPEQYGIARQSWSLRSLRTVLIQRGIVEHISVQHLRRILGEAGLRFAKSCGANRELPQAEAQPTSG